MISSCSRLCTILLSITFLSPAWAKDNHARSDFPKQDKIAALIHKQNSAFNGAVVLGISNGEKHQLYFFGSVSAASNRKPDENTLFEIGSITKVFTSMLLCDLWLRNKLSFDDHCQRFLDSGTKIPSYGKQEISIFQLATHSSGLPRDPDNLPQRGKYGKEEFHQYLRHCKLKFAPGSKFLYSNTGYRLLGEIIEELGQKPFTEQLQSSIISPLKLKNTSMTLSPAQTKLLADAHGPDGQRVESTPLSGGATGGLKSNAGDLLSLIDLCLSKKQTRMHRLIEETCKRRFQYSKEEAACLGWFRNEQSDSYGKYGQIDGYSSSIEFSPSARCGIVVLSSTLQIDAAKLSAACSRLMQARAYPEKLN